MKTIKMALYGEPGVGKSTFACHAPKPFFVTTDGNYEWLEEFGAKEEDHKQVYSWDEAKKVFKAIATPAYDKYQTIVIDLAEDLLKWNEAEFCTKSRIEHMSDLPFGKSYDITRNDYFLEICKLFALPKNVILIMHGGSYVQKDRRGVEHTKHGPTSRMPEKVVDMIEGRTRYFLRCYVKGEEQSDGTIIKKRYLSLIPKENEYGIARGLDENKVPHDIELDWNVFAKIIGLDQHVEVKIEPAKQEIKIEPAKQEIEPQQIEELVKVVFSEEQKIAQIEKPTEQVAEQSKATEQPVQQTESVVDKMAAIKAKLAAIKNQKK